MREVWKLDALQSPTSVGAAIPRLYFPAAYMNSSTALTNSFGWSTNVMWPLSGWSPGAMSESKRFTGLTVLVTGASSGIGRATALKLAEEGANVGLAGRRRARLDDVAAQAQKAGTRALVLEGDVRDDATCARFVAECDAAFGGLDGLVNAAGVIGNGVIDDTPPGEWDRIMDNNLRSRYLMTRAAAESLKKKAAS